MSGNQVPPFPEDQHLTLSVGDLSHLNPTSLKVWLANGHSFSSTNGGIYPVSGKGELFSWILLSLYLQKVLFTTAHMVNFLLGCAGVMKLASDCVVEDSHFM